MMIITQDKEKRKKTHRTGIQQWWLLSMYD